MSSSVCCKVFNSLLYMYARFRFEQMSFVLRIQDRSKPNIGNIINRMLCQYYIVPFNEMSVHNRVKRITFVEYLTSYYSDSKSYKISLDELKFELPNSTRNHRK